MKDQEQTLEGFVAQARVVMLNTTDESQILVELAPLAHQIALSRSWLIPQHYEADVHQGFGSTILHVNEDLSLFIVAVSWLPKRGTPPHNHGTWAIVVGVEGVECDTRWENASDYSGGLTPVSEQLIRAGEVVTYPTGSIHSIQNRSLQTSLSFHVYGRHLQHTGRSQFNPKTGGSQPFPIRTRLNRS